MAREEHVRRAMGEIVRERVQHERQNGRNPDVQRIERDVRETARSTDRERADKPRGK